MRIYSVTYCTMDRSIGANLFWHTSLLLSRYDDKTKKMEVVEAWGFYGVPSTTTNEHIRKLKSKIKFDLDLYGNHGVFHKEEIRFLEQGLGLHGITFEISENKYNLLKDKCNKVIAEQNAAIEEAANDLKLQPLPNNNIRKYPYEHESPKIYQHELKKAQEQQRPPRLKEFSLLIWPVGRTCKSRALELLNGIITPEQLTCLHGGHPAIPRLSGKMEDIYLHSTGPLCKHTKKSGENVYYRQANEANLYWTLPPQAFEALTDETSNLLTISEDYCDQVKTIIQKLQKLEWFFINANLPDVHTKDRTNLLAEITSLYEAFSHIEPKQSQFPKNDWPNFFKWLSSQPRNTDEMKLLTKLTTAKDFINTVYMVVLDKLETEDNIGKLAPYLSVNQQKEICNIIGRTYIEDNYHSQAKVNTHEANDSIKTEGQVTRFSYT